MLDQLLEWDRDIFVYLNKLGIENWDTFWTVATEILSWTPLFILFLILILSYYPGRRGKLMAVTVLGLLGCVLALMAITKAWVARLRPNQESELREYIRILKDSESFSFFSGHAATSFAITTIVVLFLRRKTPWIWLSFLWPIIFSFSRIYVGVHYPFDIVTGLLVGVGLAFLFYRAYYRFIEPGID